MSALNMIKKYEGLRLTAYQCPAGKWTIGYGHTGPDVHPGLTITQAQAEALLARDVESVEVLVEAMVAVDITDSQRDSLVSFTYNLGAERLRKSTLLAKLNAGDIQGAANEFSKWCHCNGQVLPGLVKRRAAEQRLFLESGP